jgi:membrane protein YdbS with pleckstrin-like domain
MSAATTAIAPQLKPVRAKRRKSSRLSALVSSALVWLFACVFFGAGATVLGIFVLAGIGWGIVAIGITFLMIAALLQIGIARG